MHPLKKAHCDQEYNENALGLGPYREGELTQQKSPQHLPIECASNHVEQSMMCLLQMSLACSGFLIVDIRPAI